MPKLIEPLTNARRRARIAVYDLEWLPTGDCRGLPLRLIGCRYKDDDGIVKQRHWKAEGRQKQAVSEFLDWALQVKHHGTRYYAHAGGLADILFLLAELIRRQIYHVEAIMSGSSAIIVSVKRGRYRWVFVDSYWTLKSPLAKIGEKMGLAKLDCPFDAPIGELMTYNARDCEILFDALHRFEDELFELGGQLRLTLASCAMDLFRRVYLLDTLETEDEINTQIRSGYHGGRTEVYRFKLEGRGNYYDINSSYAYSMTKALPGNFIGYSRKLTPGCWADVTVESEGYVPALPFKRDALYFPTGEFRGWYYLTELDQAGVTIKELHNVATFEPQTFMCDYSQDLYARRLKTTDDFSKESYKLLLNSLYGKTCERSDKTRTVINPDQEWRDNARMTVKQAKSLETPVPIRWVMPNVYSEDIAITLPHEHVAIGAAITALSRVELRRHMTSVNDLYYSDTDSVITTDELPTSKDLGGLKFEHELKSGEFLAPKVYSLELPKGHIYKAKGFPLKSITQHNGMTDSEVFDRIRAKEAVQYRSMDRVMTQLARPSGEDKTPIAIEKQRTKSLRLVMRPKRCPEGENNTRAWSVDEL